MSWNAYRFRRIRPAKLVPKLCTDYITEHHRKPKSKGGTSERRNISLLKWSFHWAWHHLFKCFDPYRIAQEINEKYLDPDYMFIVVRRRKGG